MKVIVSGSRVIGGSIKDLVEMCIAESGFEVTEVVSGCAKGADTLGMEWAEKNGVPVAPFEADWADLSHPDALIKTTKWGQKYDARAGLRRNQLMSVYGEALIAIWDGKSKGTKHMITMARNRELPVFIYRLDKPRLTGHLKYESRKDFYSRLAKNVKDDSFAQ